MQGNGAGTERGTDLDDRPAITRSHVLQGDHGSVHVAEIADFRDASVLVGGDLMEGREHRCEGDVDPHVDRAECFLHQVGGRSDLLVVGDVGGDRERLSTRSFDVLERAVQPALSPGQ